MFRISPAPTVCEYTTYVVLHLIVIWYGTSIARNKIPNFQNPKAFILEGLEKN